MTETFEHLSVRFDDGGLLRWWPNEGGPELGFRRPGVTCYAFSSGGDILAAVDYGGVSVIDTATGAQLARRERLCGSQGLVTFAMANRVIVFTTLDASVEAWEWAHDEVLSVLHPDGPVVDVGTCDVPIVATLRPSSVQVFDLRRRTASETPVDPRASVLQMSRDGLEILCSGDALDPYDVLASNEALEAAEAAQ